MVNITKYRLPSWLLEPPTSGRDIRTLYPAFPTLVCAEEERKKRIAILEKGASRVSGLLASTMKEGARHQPSPVGCCPLLARQFQIGFVAAALGHHRAMDVHGVPYTLLDLGEAVATRDLDKIDWRRLHARLRKRITRILGEGIVVIGMGELEYDASRRKWQPHYHLMVYGAVASDVKALRNKHYRAERTGPRPMVRSSRREPATWFSYMSKIVAFGKHAEVSSGARRVRLPNDLSRAYFRYLARRYFTSFICCINCNLARPVPAATGPDDSVERTLPLRPAPRVPIVPR